jgi:pimeloyl-ACP methyl ester carboxylesterase
MIRKVFVLFILAVICLIAATAGLYHISWRFRHEVDVIRRIGPGNLSIGYDSGGQRITFLSDGLNIVGDLRQTGHGDARPGIVLLHGSSPWGRKLSLCRLMAREFSDRGYVVLSIDIRGFGESDDPVSLSDLQALDGSRDVINAVTFLYSTPHVDPHRISLVGHSMGGGLAIKAGIRDPRIHRIVAIGPPRRVQERREKELSIIQKRFSHDRRLDRQVPLDVLAQLNMSSALENYEPALSLKDHPPIFLIDGELESAADKKYLRAFYDRIEFPKKHLTVRGTGHYLNTVNLWGHGFLLYERPVLDRVIDIIDSWLRQDDHSEKSQGRPSP